MADAKLSALTVASTPALSDKLYGIDGTPTSLAYQVDRLLGLLAGSVCQGRLTTETGVAVSTSDRAAQSTIYFTPYKGNRIALYDGTRWKVYTFTERSLALSGLTAGKNYDVYIYDNAGTLTIELSAAWTNDTTRADALGTQDGVYVKSVAATRRYLGTIRASAATTTEDTGVPASGTTAKRFVWNYYNRVQRAMRIIDTTDSWTYLTNAFRSANNSNNNRVEFVQGVAEDVIVVRAINSFAGNAAGEYGSSGIGLDSTTVSSAQLAQNVTTQVANQSAFAATFYTGVPTAGYHFLQWLERADNMTTGAVWYGDAAVTGNGFQTGLSAEIWA